MVPLNMLISTLVIFELLVHLDARSCPKGQRRENGGCTVCSRGFYQPEENESNRCRVCRRCNTESGSIISQDCTSVANRQCKCRGGFVRRDHDFTTCKCDIGFGKQNGECLKCEVGFFNNQIDSPCKEWRKCSAGVNKTGTDISDNICNKESTTYVTTTTTSNKIIYLSKPGGTEGAVGGERGETLRKRNESTTTTTITAESAPGHRVTPRGKVKPFQTSGTEIGVLLLTCVIALLILTAVICKLYISPCTRQRKTAVQTQDSLCRRPVEESGDGSQSSLKQYSDEP